MNGIKLNQNVLYVTLLLMENLYGEKLRKRKIRRARTPPRRLTTAEIERRLELLPDDNENEREKFIFVFLILLFTLMVFF